MTKTPTELIKEWERLTFKNQERKLTLAFKVEDTSWTLFVSKGGAEIYSPTER
jgi:hypothetical protein